MSQLNTEINEAYASLSKHPEGSVLELWHIAFPLLIVMLSSHLMIFMDRFLLAHESTEAMNATVAASMVCFVFNLGAISIAAIAEVFVGQLNGARKYREIGEPVWQMIWFSLMTSVLYIPLALYGGKFFIPTQFETLGIPYFQWIMFAGPLFPMTNAIAAFFIGRGQTKIVTLSAVVGNSLNIFLDIILIFGVKGFIPAMGTKGAAIATAIAVLYQVIFLFAVFIKSKYRKRYGTHHFKFKFDLFWRCIRIGAPSAVGMMTELAGWTALIYIYASVSDVHATVMGVVQSIVILAMFASPAMSKALTAVCANFIGANKWEYIPKTFRSALILQAYIAGVLLLPFIIFPDPIITGFLPHHHAAENAQIIKYVEIALIWAWFASVLDGISWMISGILTSAGDTKFLMIVNPLNVWLFAIVPGYILFKIYNFPPQYVWSVVGLYAVVNSICYYLRYRSDIWKHKKI